MSRLTAGYGSGPVLHGIDLEVGDAEVVALLGANGAGKTTVLRTLTGGVRATGIARFNGQDLLRAKAHAIARLGVVHVPEGRGTFPELSVEDNLKVGALRRDRTDVAAALDQAYTTFPLLSERRGQRAGQLSGGEQQQLAVARALMAGPRLLLLDEPSAGLAPRAARAVYDALRRVQAELAVAVLVVEQSAGLALQLARRAYVLEAGRVRFTGAAADVAAEPALRRAYLGG